MASFEMDGPLFPVLVTDDTEFVTPDGTIDLERFAKNVAKAKDEAEDKDADISGPMYRVTHQQRVASKIEQVAKQRD